MSVTVTITLTFPSQADIDDGVADMGWTATIPDPVNPGQTIPNPISKLLWAKNDAINNWWKSHLIAKRAIPAANTARQAQIDAVNALPIT